jgi:hypothetical protein
MMEYDEQFGIGSKTDEPLVTGSKLQFGSSTITSGDVCFGKKMWGGSEIEPVRHTAGDGWIYTAEQGKDGWEYNLIDKHGVSIEWDKEAHEHELSGRRVLRAGLVRKKSKRVAKAYGLMRGIDNSILEDMKNDLKGSDDWIPKDEYVPLDGGEEGDDDGENNDGTDDNEGYSDELGDTSRKKTAPRKRDGKSMMGIRRKNKKKKQMEEFSTTSSISEDREYIIEHTEVLGDFDVSTLWSPTPAPVVAHVATMSPTSRLETVLPDILSFPVNISYAGNNTPSVLVEYLKSWTGYGQAVVWLTRKFEVTDEQEVIKDTLDKLGRYMLKLVAANSLYTDRCNSMIFDDHSKLRFSPACSHIRAGTWIDPSVVEAHWEDHSSQIVSTFMTGGLRVESDHYINTSPQHALLDPSLSLILSINNNTGHPKFEKKVDLIDEEVIESEVHVMMVPWSHKREGMLHQSKFKVTALYTC